MFSPSGKVWDSLLEKGNAPGWMGGTLIGAGGRGPDAADQTGSSKVSVCGMCCANSTQPDPVDASITIPFTKKTKDRYCHLVRMLMFGEQLWPAALLHCFRDSGFSEIRGLRDTEGLMYVGYGVITFDILMFTCRSTLRLRIYWKWWRLSLPRRLHS